MNDAPLASGDRIRFDAPGLSAGGLVVRVSPDVVLAVLDGERAVVSLPAHLVRREHGR